MSADQPAKSRSPWLAIFLIGLIGALWCAPVIYMIFVVPGQERIFINHKMKVPQITEWVIFASRWCVKYWYVLALAIGPGLLGLGALIWVIRPHAGLRRWHRLPLLSLAGIPVASFVIIWQAMAVPVPVRIIRLGELHRDKRLAALQAAPQVTAAWRDQMAKTTGDPQFPMRVDDLDQYLIDLDLLWDERQQIRPEVSKRYLSRMAALDAATVATWQTDVTKALGGFGLSASTVVSLLIQQERMFVRDTVNRDEMQLLRQRLRFIPKSCLDEWEELTLEGVIPHLPVIYGESMFSHAAAAMDLIGRDELFYREHWQQDAFLKMCANVKAQ